MRDPFLADHVEGQPEPHLYMTLVFDSAANGLRGMRLCEQIIERFGPEWLLHVAACNVRNFDLLAEAAAALRVAGKARVIVLALGTPLPDGLHHWLSAWGLAMADRPVVVAVLAEASGSAGAALLNGLRPLCEQFHIDLVSSADVVAAKGRREPPTNDEAFSPQAAPAHACIETALSI